MKSTTLMAVAAVLMVVEAATPQVQSVGDVKKYLVATAEKVKAAADAFVKNAAAYAEIIGSHKGNYKAAYAQDKERIDALVKAMQENYKAMDSFGYETIEGIVAGVDGLAAYDVYLDAGVPASEGPDDVAPVVLSLPGGGEIAKEGALFTYIIEPALWAGNKKWCVEAGSGVWLPKVDILTAAALDAAKKTGELLADARKWEPTTKDLFGAMVTMTPTLSDYFEDWKESRYAAEKSGRFQAVSRVSDMRGIMSSCAIMYAAVNEPVAAKDPELAKSISRGFAQILGFLDAIEAKEASGKGAMITVAEIDEMAAQAKTRTDKLVPQIEQAAVLTGSS